MEDSVSMDKPYEYEGIIQDGPHKGWKISSTTTVCKSLGPTYEWVFGSWSLKEDDNESTSG